MTKTLDIVPLIELHLVKLNSIIMAKELYKEYIGNSDLAFQENILTIIPNILAYELANDGPENHEQQIPWIIRQLEATKAKVEKTRTKGFDEKELSPDVIKASLNFINKKESEDQHRYHRNNYEYHNYQNERSKNWEKQNHCTYQDNSNRDKTNFPTYQNDLYHQKTTRMTNHVKEYNDYMCDLLQKYDQA